MTGDREGNERAAEQAARHTIQLAPNEGNGYAMLGFIETERANWRSAELNYQSAHARGFRPDDISAYDNLLHATGRLERALELDEQLENPERADDAYRRYEQPYPGGRFGEAAWSRVLLGRRDVGQIAARPDRFGPRFGQFVALLQDRDGAIDLLNELRNDPDYASPAVKATLAIWAAYLGEARTSIDLLEESIDRSASLMSLAWLPVFKDVRQRSEFKALLNKIGLVEYWRKSGWPVVCQPTASGDDFACV